MDGFVFVTDPGKDPAQLHPLVLAYMGDAVYEVYVRQFLIAQANHRPHHLHRQATRYVSAKAQAKALDLLADELTEEEADIVRRGRNAKSGSAPKNTDVVIYRHSTGFECLLGFLYYKKRFERLEYLMNRAVTDQPGSEGQKDE